MHFDVLLYVKIIVVKQFNDLAKYQNVSNFMMSYLFIIFCVSDEEVICSSLLSNVDLSELPTDVDSDYNSKDSLSVAPRTPTKKGRPVRRTESVIAREIRRQQVSPFVDPDNEL